MRRSRGGYGLPGTSLAPDSNQRPPGMRRSGWRVVMRDRRVVWRAPRTETSQRPSLTIARTIGLLTLRGYIIFAIVIVVLKLVQVATAH